ncbi:MAG: phosphoethanolamine--lipid A transferase [Desulfobulbaceae bacterium]|nr:phosphoethanolamine--lipid A transferase [Desulfobulbaceae bacterium]
MKITQTNLILSAALFFVVFDNLAFLKHVIEVYPASLKNIGFLASLAVGLTGFLTLLLTLVCSRYTTKPVLILLLLASSFASYFMNNYNVVIDYTMIQNILQTDFKESADLLSLKLFIYLCLLGLLPAFFIYTARIEPVSWQKSAIAKIKIGAISVLIVFTMILCFSKFYTSFFREHKPLRYYTNPIYYIYAVGNYINKTYNNADVVVKSLDQAARIPATDLDRELVILVVGEAVRADRFSLNGYPRETNPLLKKEGIISFSNMYSCGTSTAYSVPCMFSIFGQDEYSDGKGMSTENLLDVLSHAGTNVLWRDNNSDSKGVAHRVSYQDYKQPEVNPICDLECRDEGMLIGLQEYIDDQKEGDILIVLHQMGNHGPAYYKRYPESFEKFTPVCRTNQFDECTNDEISNGYDNAILYTDYFLSKVIELLKNNSNRFETAMVYLSDHGESLGEYGIYLHGLPYVMAPDPQKHVGALFWFGESFKIDTNALLRKSTKRFSQDNLFHTILGLFEVETTVYDKSMDIINYDY